MKHNFPIYVKRILRLLKDRSNLSSLIFSKEMKDFNNLSKIRSAAISLTRPAILLRSQSFKKLSRRKKLYKSCSAGRTVNWPT